MTEDRLLLNQLRSLLENLQYDFENLSRRVAKEELDNIKQQIDGICRKAGCQ